MNLRILWPSLILLVLASCLRFGGPDSQSGRAQPRAEAFSLLGAPLYAGPPDADLNKLESDLKEARARLAQDPDDPDRIIWVGRRLGYLWRMNEAVQVYTEGLAVHPNHAALYRHRGHRYISLRRFDDAIADFQKAAALIKGIPDEIEPDGAPNVRNIPLTTLGFNIWYHLGVAHFLKGDFERADAAFRETMKFARGLDDNVVAVADWRTMSLCRLGRMDEAAALLEQITPDMEIIENNVYHRRLLMYKGLLSPNELLMAEGPDGVAPASRRWEVASAQPSAASDLDLATMGFGVGHWHLCKGDGVAASSIFNRVVDGPYWPAFGYIAAEAELARLRAAAAAP